MKSFGHRLKTRLEVLLRKVIRLEYLHAGLAYMNAKSYEDSPYKTKIESDLKNTIKPAIKFAFVVIAFGVLFFIVWGGLAPLDSASIAEGTVIVAGNRKTIQHLEGGVVEKVLVTDGEKVTEGQTLMLLNSTRAKSELQIVTSHLNFAIAVQARLNAELEKYDSIYWDDDAFDYNDPQIDEIIRTQNKLFQARASSVRGQLAVLDERIAQKQEEIKGNERQLTSVESQLKSLNEELKNTEVLRKKGLATVTRVYELKRAYDDSLGREGQVKAAIATNREVIAETRLEKVNVDHKYNTELANEIKENHSRLLEYTERYNAAKDVLDRTTIKAPSAGIITELQVHTSGAVIGQGSKIMDIVPQNEKLIVEARVNTQDIDSIHPGLIARIQLGAFKSRLMPRIDGKVIYVSADRNSDQNNGGQHPPFYIARIEIDEAQLAALNMDVKLYPGMPATVFIVKGERTFLQYMISPIRDSFFKAFKEV